MMNITKSANSFVTEKKICICLKHTKPFYSSIDTLAEQKLSLLIQENFTVVEPFQLPNKKVVATVMRTRDGQDIGEALIKQGLVQCVPCGKSPIPKSYLLAEEHAKKHQLGFYSHVSVPLIDFTKTFAGLPKFCNAVQGKWLQCSILNSAAKTMRVKIAVHYQGKQYCVLASLAGVTNSLHTDYVKVGQLLAGFNGQVNIIGYKFGKKQQLLLHGLFLNSAGELVNAKIVSEAGARIVDKVMMHGSATRHLPLRLSGTPFSYDTNYNHFGFTDMEHQLMTAASAALNKMQRTVDVPILPATERKRMVFIDNSNIFYSGLNASGKRRYMVDESNKNYFKPDNSWRIDYSKFMKAFFGANIGNVTATLFCSTFPGQDDKGIEVKQFEQSFGKEKGVDCAIASSICQATMSRKPEECEIVLFSGDGDFVPAISDAIAKGFTCYVCAFEFACNSALQFSKNVKFHALEPYMDAFSFNATSEIVSPEDLIAKLKTVGIEVLMTNANDQSPLASQHNNLTHDMVPIAQSQQSSSAISTTVPLQVMSTVPSNFVDLTIVLEKAKRTRRYLAAHSIAKVIADLNSANKYNQYFLFCPQQEYPLAGNILLGELAAQSNGKIELEFKFYNEPDMSDW